MENDRAIYPCICTLNIKCILHQFKFEYLKQFNIPLKYNKIHKIYTNKCFRHKHIYYIHIKTWAFPYWPGFHPQTPILARDGVDGQCGSRDDNQANMEMPCIKLFITYFQHLEKRHPYWPETKSRPILARAIWASIWK